MWDQKTALSKAIWTDTSKLATGTQEISDTIWNDWSKHLEPNQIPPSLEKMEKELAKKRAPEN